MMWKEGVTVGALATAASVLETGLGSIQKGGQAFLWRIFLQDEYWWKWVPNGVKTTVNLCALLKKILNNARSPHHCSQSENPLTRTSLRHRRHYSRERWSEITFLCSTTLTRRAEVLQVFWQKQNQFMRASGHQPCLLAAVLHSKLVVIPGTKCTISLALERNFTTPKLIQRQAMSCSSPG